MPTLQIVGWPFKQSRFAFHVQSLGITVPMTYIGAGHDVDDVTAAAGEAATLALFQQDPLGLSPPLSTKRHQRNPFGREPPYPLLGFKT